MKCVSSITDNIGRSVSYTYDSNGRLLSATDPNGNGVQTGYQWFPCLSAGSIQCTEVQSVTDARGKVELTNAYFPGGQVQTQQIATGGTYQFNYTMSGSSVASSTVTHPMGRVSDVNFDPQGGVTAETIGVGTADAQTTSFIRDPATDLVQSTTDPLGRTTSYTYNAMPRSRARRRLPSCRRRSSW